MGPQFGEKLVPLGGGGLVLAALAQAIWNSPLFIVV